MATGICYTWSGNVKKYESILGPKLGVYRGGNFGPITTDAFTLSLMPSNAMCMYEIKVKGDEYIFSENNPTDYLVVKYGGVDKMFGIKKKDKPVKPDTYINYYVTFTLNSGMLNCKCDSVTNIPGTNNGNVTLGIDIELGDGIGGGVSGGRNEVIRFSWVMKNGINESKSCSVPYYLGSGFTTQSSWEIDNGDGTKTYYTFHINRDSIPSPPNSKSL